MSSAERVDYETRGAAVDSVSAVDSFASADHRFSLS